MDKPAKSEHQVREGNVLEIERVCCDAVERIHAIVVDSNAGFELSQNVRDWIVATVAFVRELVLRSAEKSEPASYLSSLVMLRSAFEVAVRLQWCVVADQGWNRMGIYWTTEDKKWANGAIQSGNFVEHAESVRASRSEFLEAAQAAVPGISPAPGIEAILINLTELLDTPASPLGGRQDYSVIYRGLSGVSHGHPVHLMKLDDVIARDYRVFALAATVRALFIGVGGLLGPKHHSQLVSIGNRLSWVWTRIDEMHLRK